jgi:hypothetical protein
MASFLFNMVGESLTKMVLRAQQNSLFCGLATDLVDNDVTILQYANNWTFVYHITLRTP